MIYLYVPDLGNIFGTADDLLVTMKQFMCMGVRFEINYDNATQYEMDCVRETEIAARVTWAIQDNRRMLVNRQFFHYPEGGRNQDELLDELFGYFRATCSRGCVVDDSPWGVQVKAIPFPSERASL